VTKAFQGHFLPGPRPNSRVNVGSTDQSVSTLLVRPDEILTKLRDELAAAVTNHEEQTELLQRRSDLDAAG
jgi:hypothetical protein